MNLSFQVEKEKLEENLKEAWKDPAFVELVQAYHLTKEEILKKVTKLQDVVSSKKNCENCKGLYECKNPLLGHLLVPKKEENMFYFSYQPCKYKIEENKNRKSEFDLNKEARMKDIDVTDKKRVKVIRWLDHFYENFDFSKTQKGLYLNGSFGSGKTFLISALFHELSEKKNVTTEIIYFPEVLVTLKDWDLYEYKMKYYETVDLLCIDDIGAEKVSEWSRDEVLGTILQSRMTLHLPTFFTSNLTLEELEIHFEGKEKDKIKARRIMERIRFLTEDMTLISENRRH